MATTVQPERILKDLAKLWIDLAKEDREKGSAGVLRACAMTLIAAVEEAQDAQSAGETIAEIVHQHPSRVIVMRVTQDQKEDLDARVFAQCWMPFGRRQQICCEQIEINASNARVDDLPKLVLGLMAPDLPVVLWCRSERLTRDAAFQQLFPLTGKIIVDSSAFDDPDEALTLIRKFNSSGRNVADLTWTRLTPLRETVAQIFENDGARVHLKDLRQVTISYAGPDTMSPEKIPACLQYMAAWFRTSLSIPVETVHAESGQGYQIRSIELKGPGCEVSVKLEDSAAEVRVNELTRRVSFPQRSDCDLLREELSVLGFDPVYRRCLG